MKYAVAILVALFLVLGMQTFTRADAPAGMQKWEYRRVGVAEVREDGVPAGDDKSDTGAVGAQLLDQAIKMAAARGIEIVKGVKFQESLTKAGAEGWELVGFGDNLWVFKRPLK